MKYPEAECLCRDLLELVGTRTKRFRRVVVWVDGTRFELLDTLLVEAVRGDQSLTLQISSDGHRPWSVWQPDHRYTIRGEWSDREREELVEEPCDSVPLTPDSVHGVWHVDVTTGQEMLIGAILGVAKEPKLCLNVDRDDIIVCSPASFWKYVEHVLPARQEELHIVPM